MIRNVPIPTAGVMLGLAALGNLLAPWSLLLKYACGLGAVFLGALLLLKIILHPQVMKNDLNGNSIFASVFATFFMAVMQLCTYIHPSFPFAAETVWFSAVAGHFLLMAWFTWRYMMNFALRDVFPTYFIAYVGVIVASVTAPVFGRHAMGEVIFWFGFAAYMVLFALVTARYCSRHKIADPAKPLFCIYAAPMSLSLAGYLASVEEKSLLMIAVMQVLAQFLFFAVLSQMPKLLRLPFYPSYAAFTFHFVITAIALRQTLAYVRGLGIVLPEALDALAAAEIVLAAVIVAYVFLRYVRFLHGEVLAPAGSRMKAALTAAVK